MHIDGIHLRNRGKWRKITNRSEFSRWRFWMWSSPNHSLRWNSSHQTSRYNHRWPPPCGWHVADLLLNAPTNTLSLRIYPSTIFTFTMLLRLHWIVFFFLSFLRWKLHIANIFPFISQSMNRRFCHFFFFYIIFTIAHICFVVFWCGLWLWNKDDDYFIVAR